jgi:hypothetical protein
VAEQCSRHRRKGAHCLSAASLCAAGIGEPRREPEGPHHGQHGFAYFCRNKSGSSFGGETPSPKDEDGYLPKVAGMTNCDYKNLPPLTPPYKGGEFQVSNNAGMTTHPCVPPRNPRKSTLAILATTLCF